MIIFGQRASKIGTFEGNGSCDYCNNQGTQQFSVYGKYAHVFWIPTFPMGSKAFSECTHCKKTLEKKNFPPEILNQYNKNKGNAKRPIWHWSGLLLFGLLVLYIAFAGKTT